MQWLVCGPQAKLFTKIEILVPLRHTVDKSAIGIPVRIGGNRGLLDRAYRGYFARKHESAFPEPSGFARRADARPRRKNSARLRIAGRERAWDPDRRAPRRRGVVRLDLGRRGPDPEALERL